jgi:hypothetical protein
MKEQGNRLRLLPTLISHNVNGEAHSLSEGPSHMTSHNPKDLNP